MPVSEWKQTHMDGKKPMHDYAPADAMSLAQMMIKEADRAM
jgi:hypothetical protein